MSGAFSLYPIVHGQKYHLGNECTGKVDFHIQKFPNSGYAVVRAQHTKTFLAKQYVFALKLIFEYPKLYQIFPNSNTYLSNIHVTI